MYRTKFFSVPGKKTNRSLARTKHARSENFFDRLKKKKIRSVLVPSGFWQQIDVAWCFVDQNSTFKMYFSDQIRQIKKIKKKITEEGPLKKTKKEEEEEEDFQWMTKEKRDLRLKGREMTLQQHGDERKKELAQRREMTQSGMYCTIFEDIS